MTALGPAPVSGSILPTMSRAVTFALVLAFATGCGSDPAPAPNPGNAATQATGWYRGDLHFHTNYSEDAKRQGGDDLGQALLIADAWRAPVWVKAHPDWTGDGLDFIEVSDHRTAAALQDPAFHSDHLIVIPGEEYGDTGHANTIGIRAFVDQVPAAGQSKNDHTLAAIAATHAQGALFSVNHPCQYNRWMWGTDGIDGVEVWNGPWMGFFGETTEADFEAEAQETGIHNDYIQGAVAHSGGGANEQALWFWYGMLTRGYHPALLGGSDRHMIVPPAVPTTYVEKPGDAAFAKLSGKALGYQGIVAGIRAGATFVSSSPHGPQVLLEAVDGKGVHHRMGSELAAGTSYTIDFTVTRASGGLLQLVGGDVVPGSGPVTPAPKVLDQWSLTRDIVTGTYVWQVPAGGAWLHAVVLAPRIPTPLPAELDPVVKALSVLPPQGKSVGAIVQVLGVIVDPNVLFDPKECDPAKWDPFLADCMPADTTTWATFYFPTPLLHLMNTYFVDGQPTKWSMGALSSAFLAK